MTPSLFTPVLAAAEGVSEAAALYGIPQERTVELAVAVEWWEFAHKTLARRTAEIVAALVRPDGRVWLHTKGEYPPGVYRLMSGGVHTGEPILAALQRELWEETGLTGAVQQFLGILTNRWLRDGAAQTLTSYLFIVQVNDDAPQPNDADEDIIGFRAITPQELLGVADELEHQEGLWADWGRFRAPAHRLVAQALRVHAEAAHG